MKVWVRSAWLGSAAHESSSQELSRAGNPRGERGEPEVKEREQGGEKKKEKWHPGDLDKSQKEQGTKYQGSDS